jgi:ankyrin repeat protein
MQAKLIVPRPRQRGTTELHYAAYHNDPDAVRVQVQLGGPIDVHGWTPLHCSIDMAQAWGELVHRQIPLTKTASPR